MQLSPTRLLVCNACGAVLPVGEEHLGKKCRCGRCGEVNVVAEETPRRSQQSSQAEKPIYFFCRVCDTRLGARVKHVGRKAKCPDCGALTRVPSPPQPAPPNQPKAMHGQQYGVWGVDDAPSPAEIAEKQPKFFAVWCRVCDTLMHARPEQVGKKITCPDCGATTKVKKPLPPKPKKSPLVPDGQEYQLDTSQAPPARPEQQFVPPAPSAGKTQPELPPIREERKDRPKLPPIPIVQGVALMLVRMPVLAWFLWLSAAGMTTGTFMVIVTRLNPIAAIPFFVSAGLVGIICLIALSAISLQVFTESSEGNDCLHQSPAPIFLDWMGDIFYLATPAVIAMAPWWALCQLLQAELSLEQQGLVMMVGWLFTFPLLLLSTLENGSPLEPFSMRVFGSVSRRPFHWLLLVVESTALTYGVVIGLEKQLLANSILVSLLAIPLYIAAVLLYFRILGRFAWWLADSLATIESS